MHAADQRDDDARFGRTRSADALVEVLAHELRTPITTIYAGSSVLARDEALLPAMRRELATSVQAESARLFRVVEDLLVLTRLERGTLHLDREPILLDRVVDLAVRLEGPRWPDLRVTAHSQTDVPPVRGDGSALAHVFRNLIASTGWRASGGSLDISVTGRASPDVVCRLVDRTASLHGEDLPALFDLPVGQPAGEPRSAASGPGIAMFIAARLIEAMQGRISVRALDGGVVEITVTMPRDDTAPG